MSIDIDLADLDLADHSHWDAGPPYNSFPVRLAP